MELQQVRYFLAVCDERNFTRAAKRCGISQPSLSNAIRRLEQQLGGRLFHRSRVNCSLSELGQQVRPHLARIIQCTRDAERQAAHFLDGSPTSSTASIMASMGSSIRDEERWKQDEKAAGSADGRIDVGLPVWPANPAALSPRRRTGREW
ncbi:LysR family transcriptional regulator [Phreatobacter stygius]|uniref:LysR family transcriptional regulator n=1 Tax=Phreatobacter stygius TaxID=1940610 RepID=A0A4D7ARS9_9HYPH|nr:LysR family transcriptional regulator [Phreatobacter stygius]QCI63679.1 LysR family transcriptional regulator [Phreatobacter stygius]